MSVRNVPPRASSRLDLAAHLPPREAVTTNTEAVDPPALKRRRVTWLADMLTPDSNSFGVVRLLLALAVLVSHSIYLTTGKAELEPLYRWTNYTLGQHGVQIFFFLSGILVAQSLFKSRSVRDYATARALRIFPALIVCVLATALIAGPLLSTLPGVIYLKDQSVAAYIAKTLSLWSGSAQLPGLFQDNPVPGVVNTSVWTLKYEAMCYALLGLVGLAAIKTSQWRAVAAGAIVLWLAVVLYKPTGLELHGGAKSTLDVLRYFTIFFGAGVLAYVGRNYIPVHVALLVPLGALFALAIGTRWQEPAAAIVLGYAAIWVGSLQFGGLRTFTNANDYSYATYLYHMPVAQVLLHFWPQMHVIPLILAASGIVLWISCLSWDLVEKPALAWRHRIWGQQPKVALSTAADVTDSRVTANPTSIVTSPAGKLNSTASTASEIPAAGRAVPVQTAQAKATEPGRAQVWRPMPTGRKLKIHQDSSGTAGSSRLQDSAKSAPLDLVNPAVKAGVASAAPQDALTPRVPAGRIAFAIKQTAAAVTSARPPVTADAGSSDNRARTADAASDEAAPNARARFGLPRPTWSQPIGGEHRQPS